MRDPAVRAKLARLNRRAWNLYGGLGRRMYGRDERMRKILDAVQWQADHFEEIPVIVVACLRGFIPAWPPVVTASVYGSIFPSVQNLLLAARAAGLGAALITLPLWSKWLARRALGLPWNVQPVRGRAAGLAARALRADDAPPGGRGGVARPLRQPRVSGGVAMTAVGRIAEVWRYPVKSMGGESLAGAGLGPRGMIGDRGWALRDESAGEIRGAKKMPVLMRCRARYDAEPNADRVPPATMTLPDGTQVRTGDADVNARLSALVGRSVTLWPIQPAESVDHYRRALPDNADIETELRAVFGRLPEEPLPDFTGLPPELFEFTSPLGTYFDAFPVNLLTTASLRAMAARNPAAQFDRRRFRPNFLVEPLGDASGLVEAGWCGRRLRVGGAVLSIAIPAIRCSMTTQATDELPKDPSVLRTIVRDGGQCLGVYATVEEAGPVAVGDQVELL